MEKIVKAWAVLDSVGIFTVQAGLGETKIIEPISTFTRKADAKEFASQFGHWDEEVLIIPCTITYELSAN